MRRALPGPRRWLASLAAQNRQNAGRCVRRALPGPRRWLAILAAQASRRRRKRFGCSASLSLAAPTADVCGQASSCTGSTSRMTTSACGGSYSFGSARRRRVPGTQGSSRAVIPGRSAGGLRRALIQSHSLSPGNRRGGRRRTLSLNGAELILESAKFCASAEHAPPWWLASLGCLRSLRPVVFRRTVPSARRQRSEKNKSKYGKNSLY